MADDVPPEGFNTVVPVASITAIDKTADIPIFNIRDGVPNNLGPLIIRPTVPDAYKWVPITGVDAGNAAGHIDLFIRSALVNFERSNPGEWDAARKLNAAVILGTARAVTTWVYNITAADLIASETLAPIFMLQATGAIRVANGLGEGPNAVAVAALNLSETHNKLINSVIEYAAGILPLQGYCLLNTQHHYLSDGNGVCRKAFLTVERQFWKSSATKDFYSTDAEIWRDVLWHKACHPIQIPLKRTMAIREDTKSLLEKMGVGSAAARLPALESELRAASTWVTVMKTVSQYFVSYGGRLDYSYLEWAVDVAKAMPATGGAPAVVPPKMFTARLTPAPEARVYERPDAVADRTSALQWVQSIMDKNSAVAALAYGFYCALSESVANSLGEGFVDTLKNAYSLNKLRSQSMASFAKGVEAHKDYLSYKSRERADGNYVALRLTLDA